MGIVVERRNPCRRLGEAMKPWNQSHAEDGWGALYTHPNRPPLLRREATGPPRGAGIKSRSIALALHRNAMKKESEILAEAGASCMDHAILLVLEEFGPLGPSEISRKLGIPTVPDAGVDRNGKKVKPVSMSCSVAAGFIDRLSCAGKVRSNSRNRTKWELAD